MLSSINTVDLFLGAFLIFCGFALSLLNLRRVVIDNTRFSAVLLSENILLMCIGIAFMMRAMHQSYIMNVHTYNIEERIAGSMVSIPSTSMECGFRSVLMSYGPLIVSLVNSFISLIIDNYMHYKMIIDIKVKDDENVVQEIGEEPSVNRKLKLKGLFSFWKKYFSYVVVALQWIVPVLIALTMYPMGVNKMEVSQDVLRSRSGSCMAMVNHSNETCTDNNISDNETNYSSELRKYFKPPKQYVQVYENEQNNGNASEINSIIKNVLQIITRYQNDSFSSVNVTSGPLVREPKSNELCMKICYVDNKNLLMYMLTLIIISYFIPITISTIILTKIHVMEVKRNIKTYVSRELLYNVLFWTPVMLDTFLSLILCSYSTNSMKTSLFNVVANVYQVVKNFLNTKYFKDNAITPI